MDIQRYIASGILEQYVLGHVTPEERLEVERYVKTYPEIQQELNAIEAALESYASLGKVEAPAGLEAKILEQIDALENPGPDSSNIGDKTIGKPSGTGLSYLWLVIGLMAALAAAAWFYFQYNNSLTAQNDLQQQLTELETRCAQTSRENEQIRASLQILRDPDNLAVPMKGTEKAPQAIARVHWNQRSQKAYLDVGSLPAPPSDKQYQLWAIVDGTPVDMGVFEMAVEADLLQEVPFIATPQAFAVTLEPKGGSVGPTLEEMYVVGNVAG